MDINRIVSDFAKQRLRIPAFYKKPEPEIPYAPEIGAQPDFGLSTTYVEPYQPNPGFSPPPAGVPGLNEGMGRLSELLRQGGAMVPPTPTQAAPLNDSEAGIPALIAAIASIDPTVRESGAAHNFLQSMYGGTNARHQREAEAKTLADQQAYFSKSNQLKAETEIARTQYEGEQQKISSETEFTRKKQLQDDVLASKEKVADTTGQAKMDLEKLKQGADPEALINAAHDKVLSGDCSQERFAAYASAIRNGDPNKPALTAANTEKSKAQTKRILDMLPIEIDLGKSKIKLNDTNREYVRTKIDHYPEFLDAMAQRAAQGWARIAVSEDALRFRQDKEVEDSYVSSLKTQKGLLDDQIKEAEKGTTPFDQVGTAFVDALKQQRAEIIQKLYNRSEEKTGVNNSPSHIPNKPMQGAVPSQYGPGKGINEGYGPASPPKDQLVPEDIRNKTKASTNPFL